MTSETKSTSASFVSASDLPLVTIMLLFDSLHFIWARALVPYVSPEVSAPLVISVAAIQIGLYGWWTGRLSLDALRKHFWFFTTIGVLIAISTYFTYLAVTLIDAGTASMLSKGSAIFGVLLGLVWLRERFTRMQFVGAAIAIVGTFVIAFQDNADLRLGALIVVFSTFCYSCHFAVVKRHGGEMDFVNFLFYRMLFTAVLLILVSAGRNVLGWPSPMGWLMIILTATFDVALSRAFYYWALRKLDMSLLSVITTLGPVLTIGWALLFFDTLPTMQQLVGGAFVLIGVLIVTLRRAAI